MDKKQYMIREYNSAYLNVDEKKCRQINLKKNNEKIKILFVSLFLPYQNAPHAGGQTFNYYIKNLQATNYFDISVISFGGVEAITDAEQYGIKTYTVRANRDILSRFGNLGYHFNPWHKYGNLMHTSAMRDMSKSLEKIKNDGYSPSIIVLEWTQMLLLIDNIKKIFPNAKCVSSEHDVTYLGYSRKIDFEKVWFFRKLRVISYNNMKSRELSCLNRCDLIKTHNEKDRKLLVNDGLEPYKISALAAYYHNYFDISYNKQSKNVVFFGAMSRPENYLAAIWFIKNVMPLLVNENVSFVVIGGNPPKELLMFKSDNIEITGYVENVEEYFGNALCMVAPLSMGAGIKVKVLEAMSAGVPVLTTEIGIEGIPAENGTEYILCNTPDEYKNAIMGLKMHLIDGNQLSINARILLKNSFDLQKSLIQYSEELLGLGELE